jgi:hypothetical protein
MNKHKDSKTVYSSAPLRQLMFLLGNASLGRKRHIPLADWPEMPTAAVQRALNADSTHDASHQRHQTKLQTTMLD